MNKIADSPIQTVISAGKMEELFTMLKEFDSIKTSDCLIRNNMSIDVHITRKKGKLGNWVVTEDLSDFSSQRKQKTGKTMKSFYHYFSGEEKEVGIDLAVIAHKDTKKKRTYDGSIITEWFLIPICSPYEDEEGKVSIKTIELTTSKEEYRLLMETRVAIYDEFQDKIYPFLQVAIISVGKYLDCSAIFKIRDDYMLGTAIVLAEKISKKNVSLIIKDTESRINPILSVAGKYTKFFPPTEFFTNICSQMAAEAFFLNTWQVFDDRIIVDFVKPGDCYICSVTMGLIPGIATRATVYKFSNQTIINYLCITKEEQDMLHFHPSSKREEEREKKRQVKRERVQLVIELAKEGRSQREIAKMSGTSQSTVCRILRDPDKALAPRKTTANKTEENQTRKKESDSKQRRNDETEKSAEKVNGEKEDKAKQKNLPCEKQVENDNTNGYENSPMINERKATDYSVIDEQDAGG